VVVVDVVLKPEISDPQGQAVLGALGRLGHAGVRSVREVMSNHADQLHG